MQDGDLQPSDDMGAHLMTRGSFLEGARASSSDAADWALQAWPGYPRFPLPPP